MPKEDKDDKTVVVEDPNRVLEIEDGEDDKSSEGKVAPNQPPKSNADRAAEKAAAEAAAKEAEEAAEAAKAEEDKDKPKEEGKEEPLDTTVWGDTGDEVANSVLETLQNSGVTTEEAKALLWDAVAAGDPTKVDRDALVEKVGKAKATLIMAGVTNITRTNNEQIAAIAKVAHEAAGSKENWDKATAWANKNMPQADLDEYRGMIDKGGKAATFATTEIVKAFNADPKNTALTAGEKQVTPDAKSTKRVKGISRLEYGQALEKLDNRRASPAEFAALKAQRTAGKAQGL